MAISLLSEVWQGAQEAGGGVPGREEVEGAGHPPGHVRVWGGKASSYEHDLPGVLQGDGTGGRTVVLQVKLSSTCTLGAPLPFYTQLYCYKLPAPLPHSNSVRPSDIMAAPGTISAVVTAAASSPPRIMMSGPILAALWNCLSCLGGIL